jgi:predicted transcriptional regulator
VDRASSHRSRPPIETPVDEVMTPSVITLDSTERLRAAAEVLVQHGLRGAPVQLGGKLLGSVTLMDLNKALAHGDSGRRFGFRRRPRTSGRVVDAMDFDPVEVSVGTPLGEVIGIMDQRSIDRVLVIKSGAVVGIVTATDIARTLATGLAYNPAKDSKGTPGES